MSNPFSNPLPGVPRVESPFFDQILAREFSQLPEEWRRVAVDLHRDGFAVIDFPDPEFLHRAEAIKGALQDKFDWRQWQSDGYARGDGLRVQDAWLFDDNVKSLAANPTVLQLLSALYGRRAWPFQTLNFPVGTQQHYHTDSVHFSSVPERYMCGVWVALEDVDMESGPLVYYPGSHKWPIYVNEHLGVGTGRGNYEGLWRDLVAHSGIQPAYFTPRKGQALIWAANLLHGGARQTNPRKTRWSQVTHYFFDDCAYYTPLLSDPITGRIHFREMLDIATGQSVPNTYCGAKIAADFIRDAGERPGAAVLPVNFDARLYLAANPDVAAAGVDARQHYLQFGFREYRKLRP